MNSVQSETKIAGTSFAPFGLFSWWNWILWIILLGVLLHFAFLFSNICRHQRQDDFFAYYYRSLAFTEGRNPYDPAPIQTPANGLIRGKYLYPPMTLSVFQLLSRMDVRTAYYVFLTIKTVFLVLLITLWFRYFNWAQIDHRLFLIVCILGFGRCLERDLDAGNIIPFEEMAVWLAMLFFLRGRWFIYSLIIACVALFKVTPILLLGLCFTQRSPHAWFAAIVAAGAYLLVLFNPWLNPPAMRAQFFALAFRQKERGSINPCPWAWINQYTDFWQHRLGIHFPALPFILYGIFLLLLGGSALAVLLRHRWQLNRITSIVLILFVYALSIPRFKDYSYALMIIPALYVIWTTLHSDRVRLIAILLMCFHFYHYQQLSVILVLYSLFIRHLWKQPRLDELKAWEISRTA